MSERQEPFKKNLWRAAKNFLKSPRQWLVDFRKLAKGRRRPPGLWQKRRI
jgi:hypothetical protein